MTRPSALNTLVGRMTVGDLAQHLGLDVADVVEAVFGSGPTAATSTPRPPSKSKTRRPASATSSRPVARPAATRPSGVAGRQPTRKQLHHAVDRWLIAEVLEQEGGNVSRAARRLEVARTQLRKCWARAQALAPDQMERNFGRVDSDVAPPTRDELRALGTIAAIHEAVDQWLTNAAFHTAPGNVSEAARRMGVSRRVARELRDRHGLA